MKRIFGSLVTYFFLLQVAVGAYYAEGEIFLDEFLDTPPEQVAPFNAVRVTGNADLTIVTQPDYQIDIDGTERALQRTSVKVIDDVLFIRVPNRLAVQATIYAPTLYEIVYVGTGTGQIKANNLNTPVLDVVVSNAQYVNLAGKIGLRRVDLSRVTEASITGVDSHQLLLSVDDYSSLVLRGKTSLDYLTIAGDGQVDIDAIHTKFLDLTAQDNAYIALSGAVDLLEVTLHNQSVFNGLNLKVKDGYIKTYGNSVASVQIERLQNAIANDSSNIYYFRKPVYTATYMEERGSVLFMADEHRSRYLTRMVYK